MAAEEGTFMSAHRVWAHSIRMKEDRRYGDEPVLTSSSSMSFQLRMLLTKYL